MVKYKILDRMSKISSLLYYIFVISSVQQSNAQSMYVGDNCRTKDNLPGICRILVDCEHVVEGLRLRKINFNNLAHCAFIGSTSVICCPNNYINVNNDQTNTGIGVTHRPYTTYHIKVIESPPKKHYGHFEMPEDVELINPKDPSFLLDHNSQNDRYRTSNPVTFPKVSSISSLDVSYQDIETIPVIEYNYNDLETTSVNRGLVAKTFPKHEINIRSNNNFGTSQSHNQNQLGGTNRWQIESEYSVQNPHQNTHQNPHQNPYYASQNGNYHQHPPQTGYYPIPGQMGGHTHGYNNYNPGSPYQQNGNFHYSEKMQLPSSSNLGVNNGPPQHGTYQQNGYSNNNYNNNNYHQGYPYQTDHSGHNYYSGSHTHAPNGNNLGTSLPDHYNRNPQPITTTTTTAKTPLTVIVDTFKGVFPTITPNDQENEIEWGRPPSTTTKKPFSLIGFGLSLLTTTQKPIPEVYSESPTTTVKPGLFGTLFGQATPTPDHTTEKSIGFSFNFNPFSQSTTPKPVPQNPQSTFNQHNHQNIPNESNIYNNYPDTINSRPNEFGGVFSPIPIKSSDSNTNFRPDDLETAQSVWTTTTTTQKPNSNLNFWPFNQPENQPEDEWKPPTESTPTTSTSTTPTFGLNLNFWPFNQAENVTDTIPTTTQKSESNLSFWPFNQPDDVTESEWRPPTETPAQNVLSSSTTPRNIDFGNVWDRLVVKEPDTTAKAIVTTAKPFIFPSDSDSSSSSSSSVRPSISTQDENFSLLEPWMLNAILESSSTQSTVKNIENNNKDTSNNIGQRKSEVACEAYTKNSRPPITFHIHGGVPASSGEFPHMVALAYLSENTGETYSFDCGGSLISERYVLTAAHCVWRISRRPIFVRLGKVTLFTDEDEAQAMDVGIESFVFHPEYNSSRQYHDLALLKLTKVVTFNEYIHPACLYTNPRDLDNGIDIFATGWGETEKGARSNILLKAQLKSVPIEECQESYQSLGSHITRKIPNGITDGQMCSQDAQLIRDTCQGDSGGPIQMVDTDTQMSTIVGVVSFGFSCATEIPSVNARVAYYLDWIESVVWS